MKYCAFLRGVNVNGTSMKMAEVTAVFLNAGMKSVSTILATGNILFTSEKKSSELKIILEKSLSEHFIYEAFLFLKTENEIADMIAKNPFSKLDQFHIYVFAGIPGIEEELFAEFTKVDKIQTEKAQICGKTFYWQVPKGNTLDSSFGKILGKKDFKNKMTSRNLNTIEKIFKKF